MLKRSTEIALCLLLLVMAACSSTPTKTELSAAGERTSRSVARAETPEVSERSLVDSPNQVVVDQPELQAGSQALFDRAVEMMRAESWSAAEVLLLELTVAQPELAGPWVNLGLVHLRQGQDEQARHDFEQALAANPNNCDALNQLGVLSRRYGLFEEAAGHYQRCVEAQPNYAPAWLNLGILNELYLGQLAEALAAYQAHQQALPEPNQQVAGWVIDLERRVAAIAQR